MRDIDKRRIDLSASNRFLHAYGGQFDIVNGHTLSDRDLKFAALCHQHIIVHDTYFSCYGPLYSRLAPILAVPKRRETDLVTRFLRAGVIVPAIRQGDTMLDAWTNSRCGVLPGTNAAVEANEGSEILAFVDDETSAYANWPRDMAAANVTEFATLLNRFILSEDVSPVRAAVERSDTHPFPARAGEARAARELFFKFEALVKANVRNPKFRRADVERLVSDHLGTLLTYNRKTRPFDPQIYQSVQDLVLAAGTHDINLLAAQYLLQSTATLYEAYHANQFQTVGGLFPSHESSLIGAGVYQQLLELGGRQAERDRRPLAYGTFNVDALSIDDVIEIRKTDEFLEYCKKLRGLARPALKATFYDANQHLIDYIGAVYLPSITKRFPKAGSIQTITKFVGTVGGTVLPVAASLATSGHITVVWLEQRAMLAIICGAIGRIAGSYAPELGEFLRSWRRKKAFQRYRKNNYTGLG